MSEAPGRARVSAPRGAWRLLRSVLHAGHGALVCMLVFPFLDEAGRMRRVAWWSTRMLDLLGIALRASGRMAPGPILLLANHVSWLDILAINAVRPVRFVSKADVRHWPVLGNMVAAGGTLFIERERKRDALRVVHQVAAALEGGATVAVFPEGTTGEGRALLPFHANILQAAIATGVDVQPVALRFGDARAAFTEAVAFLGETTLAESVWRIARADRLEVYAEFLPTLPTAGTDRRALAATVRARIQHALDDAAPSGC